MDDKRVRSYNKDMHFRERPLAIVDVETSGDDELKHEILEIGLVVVRQQDLAVLDSASWRVRPHHIESAVPAALARRRRAFRRDAAVFAQNKRRRVRVF